MSSVTSEAPSSRALRHLNNRNNVAGLYLRKRLEQMEREKNFCMTYLDKDRLDVTDFLKNLQKCDSDDLHKAKFREELDSDDDLSDDSDYVRHRGRPTHTAKTAPARLRVRRHKDDDDDDDDESLEDHHPRRQIRTSVPTRRQMLVQRRQDDRRAMQSDYERTEVFLRKLRQEASREELDDVAQNVMWREFTAYLMKKIRANPLRAAAFWTGPERYADDDDEEEEETWARARMDMVYPIKRLGNIAARFQKGGDSGRNTPAGEMLRSKSRQRLRSPKKKLLGRETMDEDEQKRIANAKKAQRQRSIFDITDDDHPARVLPRPAGMPDFNRMRRDALVDTARAFGFGEAAVVMGKSGRVSPSPQESSPVGPLPASTNPFSRAAIAERRRLERQAKMKPVVPVLKPAPNPKDDPRGTDMLRALMQIKNHFRAKPLDDRIKDFMRELDDLGKTQQIN